MLGRGALVVSDKQPSDGRGCAFRFEIPLVPETAMYRIELDGRAPVASYSLDELQRADWNVEALVLD